MNVDGSGAIMREMALSDKVNDTVKRREEC